MTARSTLIFVWLLLLAAALWRLSSGTAMISDMSLFLPSASSVTEQLAVDQLREGPASRLILAGIRGGEATQRAAISRQLTTALRGQPLFLRIENGSLNERGQPAPARQRQPASPLLFEYRYLLGQSACDTGFSVSQLRSELEARLDELRSPIPLLDRDTLRSDPTACYRKLLQSWRPAEQPQRRDGVWSSANGDTALLLIETRAAATDLAIQEQAVAGIRDTFSQLLSVLPTSPGSTKPELLLTGPAVFAVSSKQTIQGEITALSSAAGIAVMLVLLLAFRSPLFLLLGALPLLTGMVAGAVAVSLVYGAIHGITIAFGITLLGVAIDYPIHAFAHAADPDHASGLRDGVRRIWPTLRLGLITTVCGYLALVSPQFPGLTQLALFAASGLIAAALCTRWVLPALAPTLVTKTRTWSSNPQRLQRFPWPRFRPWLLAVAVIIALSPLLTGYAALEDDLAALSPIPHTQLALDRELRAALGSAEPSTLIVITAADAEAALQGAEALQPELEKLISQQTIGGYELPSQLLPSLAAQSRRQAAWPSSTELHQRLQQAMQDLPFKPGSFDDFVEALQRSRTLPPLTPSTLTGSLLGLRLSTLLYPRHQYPAGWVALVPLQQIHDHDRLRNTIDRLQPQGIHLLDVRLTSNAIVYRFLQETRAKLLLGGLLMMVILAVALRNRRRLIAVVLPVVLTIAMDLAILSWIEPRLNLFHLIALLLLAGLAIDYSLFFSRQSHRPTEEDRATRFAVTLCAISTLLMFGLLGLSSLPVLHSIGITVAIGVALAYGLALLLSRERW